MNNTPMRPSLIDPTPLKKVVDSDINAWMETHLKRIKTPVLNPRRQIFKKIDQNKVKNSESISKNTLATLKREHDYLLQDTWTGLIEKKGLPSTASQRKSSASPFTMSL